MYNTSMNYEYDPFQKKAIAAIDAEKSVLVSAPTGAGKTAIAEYAITQALARNERVIYTSPIKALSNQKYRDFSANFKNSVGLLTGDVSIEPDAPLVIMTTEIYRNQLFEDPKRLERTSWVIFDEVHYLDDAERGTVWEEAIMFSPEHVRFLALSATAPNIEELAAWIESILKHPIEVIIESHRPVPLHHYFQCQGQIHLDLHTLRKQGFLNRDFWPRRMQEGRFERQRTRFSGRNYEDHLRAKANRTDELIRHVAQEKGFPCLYFAFGRKRAEDLAWEQERFDFLSESERVQVETLYQNLCKRFELEREASAIEMTRLVRRGIAFHHAGMLPTLKEVIEQLFTSKLIKLIFTTETFALGINMPAKTVIFDELRKFYGTHFAPLKTRDYFQMAGRAGRRGMDAYGTVYSRINPHDCPLPVLKRVVFGNPEPIESQFNSCYATLLNLYKQFGLKLFEIYPRSFHFFQNNKKKREKRAASMDRKLELLTHLGYIDAQGLTSKGEFASWMYGYELLLSEMLEDGYLDTLDEIKLPVLLCALVYEPRKNQLDQPTPKSFAALEKKALYFLKNINLVETQYKVYPLTKEPHFQLSRALEAWIGGSLFSELGRHTRSMRVKLSATLEWWCNFCASLKECRMSARN